MPSILSRYVEIDGIRTHYLEAGSGPAVVLLHSGEYGGAAEVSWEFTIPALTRDFHVIAPDWLGFGRTDKIYDFCDPRARVYKHLQRFIELIGVESAHFMGNSMGASNLLHIAAELPSILPMRSIVIASGGGSMPLTPARRTLLAYDGSLAAMQAIVRAMMYDEKWANDDVYIARRQALALMPGAWECASAARLHIPTAEPNAAFGKPDTIPYEAIRVPALIVAGAEDPLREPGYAHNIAARIVGSEIHVFEKCGHCPHIEYADLFNEIAIRFMQKVDLEDIRKGPTPRVADQ
jgi:pimeloyl-ACP methyl ester carboxylesterase